MTNGGWGEEGSYKQRSLKKTKMRTDSLNNFLSNKWQPNRHSNPGLNYPKVHIASTASKIVFTVLSSENCGQ